MAAYGDDANPFADPSVQSASAASMDEYNPFDSSTVNKSSAYGQTVISPPRLGVGAVSAAPSAPSASAYGANIGSNPFAGYAPPPPASAGAYNAPPSNSSGSMQDESVQLREQNLLRREQMILDREKALETRERQLAASGAQLPNWPFEYWPLVYHDIEAEIPSEHRPMVKKFYYVCLATFVALFWNFICICGIVFGATASTTEVIWAAIYFVLGVMGAWSLWYRNLYYALRDDSSFQRARHLFWFFGHFVFCVVMALGVPNWAAGGMINMIDMYKNSYRAIGTMFLVSFILWTLIALASLWLGRLSFRLWQQSGGEEKATAEVNSTASTVFANMAAQQATASAQSAYGNVGKEMSQV